MGTTTSAIAWSREKYPYWTTTCWGAMPSEVSRKRETISVLSSVSERRRMVLRGKTSSILRRPASGKFATSSAGASASRTTRSRWAKYMGKSGRSRTSLKLRERRCFWPSTSRSSQLAALGLTSAGLVMRRSISQPWSTSFGLQGIRIQVAGGLSPRAPLYWTKVT